MFSLSFQVGPLILYPSCKGTPNNRLHFFIQFSDSSVIPTFLKVSSTRKCLSFIPVFVRTSQQHGQYWQPSSWLNDFTTHRLDEGSVVYLIDLNFIIAFDLVNQLLQRNILQIGLQTAMFVHLGFYTSAPTWLLKDSFGALYTIIRPC